MAYTNTVVGDLRVTGTISAGSAFVRDAQIAAGAEIDPHKLAQRQEAIHNIPLTSLRVWDALEQPLPGPGNAEGAVVEASYSWDPNSADDTFFVAIRRYRVIGITARIEVTGTDAGAVTAAIKKAASGTDIASGTALHTGTIDLKGTVNTNQTLTLSATSSDLDIAAGTSIGIDLTGTMTAARGVVTVLLAPAPSADDLLLDGGTFGSASPVARSIDVKTLGALTFYARFTMELPAEFDDANTVKLRLHCGMLTTIADNGCTIDVAAYKSAGDATIGADLCETAAQSMNSVTFADKDFTITGTGLVAGDTLDVRVAIAVNDAATGTAVMAAIGKIQRLVDTRG